MGAERCQRTGGAAVRARLAPGCARARQRRRAGTRRLLQHGGTWGERQCRQQGEEGATRLNGCDKRAASAHHTERKGKGEGRGRPGQCELPTEPRAAAPAPARRSSRHGDTARELISGCWKENQSDRKAALHVGSHPALAAASTDIPVRLCGLPIGRGHPRGRAAAPGCDRSLRQTTS